MILFLALSLSLYSLCFDGGYYKNNFIYHHESWHAKNMKAGNPFMKAASVFDDANISIFRSQLFLQLATFIFVLSFDVA